jgi:hypothetical protein
MSSLYLAAASKQERESMTDHAIGTREYGILDRAPKSGDDGYGT